MYLRFSEVGKKKTGVGRINHTDLVQNRFCFPLIFLCCRTIAEFYSYRIIIGSLGICFFREKLIAFSCSFFLVEINRDFLKILLI